MPGFELPDTMTSLPLTTFEFSPAAGAQVSALAGAPPQAIFHRLLRDQESEVSLLLARRVLAAFLPGGLGAEATGTAGDVGAGAAREVAAAVAAARDALMPSVRRLAGLADAGVRGAVLRQRAPIALLAGCWLDTLSQPATQPAVVVNGLFSQHFKVMGEGDPQRSLHHLRRRALEAAGVRLPDFGAADFLAKAGAHPLTALHGSFYLALSRLPASFLPEVAGVQYAFHALGIDDLLTGTQPLLTEAELRAVLAGYLALAGAVDQRRLRAAADLAVSLEREHVALLEALAARLAGQSLDARVAEIIARHGPYAGSLHHAVKVGGHRLADLMSSGPEAVMRELRNSRLLAPLQGGDSRFVRAMKFGGPMFGVFTEDEAAALREWAQASQPGGPSCPAAGQDMPGPAAGHTWPAGDQAAAWAGRIVHAEVSDVVFTEPGLPGDRELLYRLVNIEHFANTLPLARERARQGLREAEILFTHGSRGRFTDASYFDYTTEALMDRLDKIYWDKMGECRSLEEIPDREEVIFGQKLMALGNLVDGAWAHRIANLGRFQRPSDGLLFGIYADEMGRGDLRKNHITVIHQVLRSLEVELPHLRDAAFKDQGELLDEVYGYSVYQLCLALFPDSFYNEILGYNLGIEMFGLGELRLHEMQRLSHHGFDDSYERLHLSIDNFSAGHARQSAEAIVAYLDGVQRRFGEADVQAEWRRIWRGYASFAYFIEDKLVRSLDLDLVI